MIIRRFVSGQVSLPNCLACDYCGGRVQIRPVSCFQSPMQELAADRGYRVYLPGWCEMRFQGEESAEPRIKCLYKVKGVAYTPTIEDAGLWNSTQWEWGNVSRYYPSPFACTMQYDPKNPRWAFVKPQEGRQTWWSKVKWPTCVKAHLLWPWMSYWK